MPALAQNDGDGWQQAWGQEWDRFGCAAGFQPMASVPSHASIPTAPIAILQVTDDVPLARTREHLFRKAGLDVCTISSRDNAESVVCMELAAVLFCQSIHRNTALSCATIFQQHRRRAILVRISPTPLLDEEHFDVILAAPVAPGLLVQEARRWRHNYQSAYHLG